MFFCHRKLYSGSRSSRPWQPDASVSPSPARGDVRRHPAAVRGSAIVGRGDLADVQLRSTAAQSRDDACLRVFLTRAVADLRAGGCAVDRTTGAAQTSIARVRCGRPCGGPVPAVLPGHISSRRTAGRPAHRIRLSALLRRRGHDVLSVVDQCQPGAVHASGREGLRHPGLAVVRCRLLLLRQVVHLGVVPVRGADERGHLPSLCTARSRTLFATVSDRWTGHNLPELIHKREKP